MTLEELCRILDLTPGKLRELCNAGILSQSVTGAFDMKKNVLAYCRFLHAQLAERGIDAVSARVQPADDEPMTLERQKLEADVRIAKAKAEQEEMKLDALGRELRVEKKDDDVLAFKPVDTITGISKILGISVPSLWKLAHGVASDTFPKTDNGKHYNTREVLQWYYQRLTARDTSDLKKQELAEAVRIKRAKADLAEGKAVPVEDALSIAQAVYEACWQTIEGVCRRGSDEEETEASLRFARGEFQGLRKRLEALNPPNR